MTAEGDSAAVRRALAIADAPAIAHVAETPDLFNALQAEERLGVAARMLASLARRALQVPWGPDEQLRLAVLLQSNNQFDLARRLYGRIRAVQDIPALREKQALCTYKDVDLPTDRRLDRALELLSENLAADPRAETLGLAGAILKRKWELDAQVVHLRDALVHYRRGYERPTDDPEHLYCGINAAYVCDQLAPLSSGPETQALHHEADAIRTAIVDALGDLTAASYWDLVIAAEARLGLGDAPVAAALLERARPMLVPLWQRETTAIQLASVARLRAQRDGVSRSAGDWWGREAVEALLPHKVAAAAVRRAYLGKVGLALSGGGFRASLYHLGVLARMAELDLLRRVEVLSCVSGGSIVGAAYYLRLRAVLSERSDDDVTAQHYMQTVEALIASFIEGVQRNNRVRLATNVKANLGMITRSGYSRTNRNADLFDANIFPKDGGEPWRLHELCVQPPDRPQGFSPKYENWLRAAKVPILVLNANTLNTGHAWQFTASWMGEPGAGADDIDANARLRRVYHSEAPQAHRQTRLATAVAASACVPGLFPPIELCGLYGQDIRVELVDGGVHDNQGTASLLAEDCTVVVVSDASGQIGERHAPGRTILSVFGRMNSVLMSRVRGAQYRELRSRLRAGSLRGLAYMHLKGGLSSPPIDQLDAPDPYDAQDEPFPSDNAEQQAAYGIDPRVQRALSELRTDLDTFTDDECDALMAAGYLMAHHELHRSLNAFPLADPPLEPTTPWRFAAMTAAMADPDAHPLVMQQLDVGKARFLKPWRLWRRRHGRAGGTGPVKLAIRGARGLASVAATAARCLVAVPAAPLGAAASATYLKVVEGNYMRWLRRNRASAETAAHASRASEHR